MKLHWKLSLVLVVGVLVVVSLTQAVQYFTVTNRISNLSSGDLALMRQREETAARNICDAVGHSVASSLERGEMEKFSRILQQQRTIKGLLEFSLFNRDGVVTQSSEVAAKGRSLTPELMQRFVNDHREWIDSNSERIQIYRPQVVKRRLRALPHLLESGRVGRRDVFQLLHRRIGPEREKRRRQHRRRTRRTVSQCHRFHRCHGGGAGLVGVRLRAMADRPAPASVCGTNGQL